MQLFNEKGILKIDELVESHPSWQNIMADGVVTAEELSAQADKVTALLHAVDEALTEEHKELVQSLLAESSVLFAAHHVYQLQELVQQN